MKTMKVIGSCSQKRGAVNMKAACKKLSAPTK